MAFAACTPPVEDCNSPGDEDDDGYADCEDEVCWVPGGGCQEVCDSFFDEDADGVFGCFDDDCWVADGNCAEVCDSTFDEDGDGTTDCEDSDCWVLGGFCTEQCETDNDEDGDGKPGCLDNECWVVDGPCEEVCSNFGDEDVDGLMDCDDPDCFDEEICIPTFSQDIQPIFQLRCGKSGCHVGDLPAGAFSIESYEDIPKPSYYCQVQALTKGECALVRLLDESMPQDGTQVPQLEIDLVQRWVDGGLLE